MRRHLAAPAGILRREPPPRVTSNPLHPRPARMASGFYQVSLYIGQSAAEGGISQGCNLAGLTLLNLQEAEAYVGGKSLFVPAINPAKVRAE